MGCAHCARAVRAHGQGSMTRSGHPRAGPLFLAAVKMFRRSFSGTLARRGEQIIMKKLAIVFVAVFAISASACKKKDEEKAPPAKPATKSGETTKPTTPPP